MRHLAIDPGSRRVGLALSDASGRWATPHEVLEVRSLEAAMEPVLRVIRQEGVERLVVGLPLNMDGSIGPAARQAGQWGLELSRRASLPVVFIDERLSSFEAEQQLADRKRAGEHLTRARKKRQLDAVSAAVVLQAFLDGKLAPVDVEGPGR
jgi:putative holliday junction resolvase